MAKIKYLLIDLPKLFLISLFEMFQFVYGSIKITRISSPRITFFGGARLPDKSPYNEMAYNFAKILANNDISIMTGGGPGVMQSANKGATEVAKLKNKKMSFGITVKNLPHESDINVFAQSQLTLNNYFMRTALLINQANGFVIFPGGFGTLDELATVLTLIQIKQLKKMPVILVGKEFWEPLRRWIFDCALEYGTISKEETDWIAITDDVASACGLLVEYCKIK